MMQTTVNSICRKEGLSCREVQPLRGGQVNQVFLVDNRYVVRIGARQDAFLRLKTETERMQGLGGQIPVPKIYAFGEVDGLVYQIQQFIPGQKLYLVWKDLTPNEQEAVVADLAASMKILHSQVLPFFGDANQGDRGHSTWGEYLAQNFQATLAEINRLNLRMLPGIVELAYDYFDRHNDVLQSGTPTLVHSDLTFMNILVHQGRVSALLDFEYALQGPKDYELWALEAFCLYPNDFAEEENEVYCAADFAGFFPLLRKHYPEIFETPDLRERMNLYHLEAALGSHLAWRKDNLAAIPPDRMAAKEFYLGRIGNFVYRNGARLF